MSNGDNSAESPDSEDRNAGFSSRRYLIRLSRLLFVVTIVICLWPVSFGLLRLAVIVFPFIIVVLMGCIYWRRGWFKAFFVTTSLILLIVMFAPDRKPDRAALQDRYVSSLRGFRGTKYVWGGENRFGIDCSGLARKGMINAAFKEGVLGINPAGIRDAIHLWWYDTSAKALMEEYRGFTELKFSASSINEIEKPRLIRGDIAVTADGVHTLIYLGDGEWIEADPGLKRVITLEHGSDVLWLKVPVKVLEWRYLKSE